MAGVRIVESTTDDGRQSLIAVRWALCREFTDIDELSRWLDQVAPRRDGSA